MTDETNIQDKAREACQSRLDDIKRYFYATPEFELIDDGSADTVIQYGPDSGDVFRLSDTSDYRDANGTLDLDACVAGERLDDDAADQLRERWHEYGLAFDYVPAGTFNDQEQGYFRYQISFGGPSEEVRFYCDPDLTLYKAEFWYLDWFTGAHVLLTGSDLQWARDFIEECKECGTLEHVMKEARD